MSEAGAVIEQPAELKDESATVAISPNLKAMIQRAESAMVVANEIQINDNDDYQFAVDNRNSFLVTIDALETEMKDALGPLAVVVNKVRGWFKPGIANTQAAVKHLNGLISAYDAKLREEKARQDALQIEEERAQRQKAEQVAAEARAVGEQQAAAQRKIAEDAENARKAAAAKGDTVAAEAAAATAARATEAAAHAVETGHANAEAATVQAAASMTTRVVAAAPVVTGNSMREHWVPELAQNTTAEQAKIKIILEIADLHRAGKPNPLLGLMEVDEKALKQLAKSLKKNMAVPGYVAKDKPIPAGSKKTPT